MNGVLKLARMYNSMAYLPFVGKLKHLVEDRLQDSVVVVNALLVLNDLLSHSSNQPFAHKTNNLNEESGVTEASGLPMESKLGPMEGSGDASSARIREEFYCLDHSAVVRTDTQKHLTITKPLLLRLLSDFPVSSFDALLLYMAVVILHSTLLLVLLVQRSPTLMNKPTTIQNIILVNKK